MRHEALLLEGGVGGAEAGEVHAVVALHESADALRVQRVERGAEDLEVALLEHHAAVGGAGGLSGDLVMRDRRGSEAELVEQPRRRVEVGHEMRKVVEAQVPRGGTLLLEGRYFSPPRPRDLLITSFMISLVPP